MHPAVLYRTQQAERTRREILNLAVDIASAEGLEGLTIGRLAGEVGMSKTGLFAHFGSKEELQLATVHAAKEIFMDKVVRPAFEKPRGVARLRAMLEHWLGYVERIIFRGGCFFAAASAEFDSRPGAVRDCIRELTRAWLDALEEEIRFAQTRQEISRSIDSTLLAFELHAYVQEANWAFKLFDDKSAFSQAQRAICARIIDAARNASATRHAKQSAPKAVTQTRRGRKRNYEE